VSDPTINLPPNAEVVDNGTRIVTSRARNPLIVLMGVAAAATPNYVHYHAPAEVYESETFIQPWTFKSRLILNAYPNDIGSGWDNFVGVGEPEPPFIQQQKGSLPVVLTQNVPYNPNLDIRPFLKRTPYFDPPQEFVQPQKSVINTALRPNPPPIGDLTTLRRKPAVFEEAKVFDSPYKYAWYIPLLPGLAPLPPPPPVPPPTTWPLPSAITNLPGRGTWELPGGQQAVWVIGSGAFLMTVKTAATAYTPTTFNMKRIGTLKTSVGDVGIRDNGAGGYVCIVDGPYGYLYNIKTKVFSQITDPAFLGADRIAFIDGWWIFNQPGTQVFYTPKSTYSIQFDASFFALTDAATDNLVTLMESKEELWLICEKHTEIWYDAGGQFFGFQRLVSTMLQVGCSAKHSIARFNDSGQDGLIWFGRSDRGENVVVRTRGFEAQVVSTPAVSDEIATYAYVADATGYTYQEDGHEFYMLTFPSADKTWCFDGSTEMWHKRASYDPYSDSFHRHRSSCFLNFQNQRLVADYQNGSIYQMTREAFTDAGWPLLALRRTPHVWDGGARERVYMASVQIEFAPGEGNQSGTGYDPQVYLKNSRDGGKNWSQMFARGLGKVGEYLNRVIWRKLSFTRDGVMEVRVIDPVKRDIVGANLKRAAK
jgi:hypothetical protein